MSLPPEERAVPWAKAAIAELRNRKQRESGLVLKGEDWNGQTKWRLLIECRSGKNGPRKLSPLCAHPGLGEVCGVDWTPC